MFDILNNSKKKKQEKKGNKLLIDFDRNHKIRIPIKKDFIVEEKKKEKLSKPKIKKKTPKKGKSLF